MVANRRIWLLGGEDLGAELAGRLEEAGVSVWHQAVLTITGNLTAAAQTAAQEAHQRLGGLEGFVYLAKTDDLDGRGAQGALEAVTRETGRFVLAAREVVRLLGRSSQGGNLVCVCDIAGLGGRPQRMATSAASAALIAGAKSLAKELGRQRIAVNVLAIGPLEGHGIKEVMTLAERELFAAMGLGRPGGVTHLAANLRHLIQGEHWMTGQVLRMDDGLVI